VCVLVKVVDSGECDRLIALSDSWVRRPDGCGVCRWCHRELSDDRVATARPAHLNAVDSGDHHRHRRRHQRRNRAPGAGEDSSSTSEASPVVGGGASKRSSSSRASPVVVVAKDSSSCGETPSSHGDAVEATGAEFHRSSVERFSLRGARNALRRGVDNLIGRRTSALSRKHHHQHHQQQQINGGGGRLEIGDPVPVASEALQRTMERLGCVDLLTVDQPLDGGAVRRPRSSDSLVADRREGSPCRLSVHSLRVTPERVETSSSSTAAAPTSVDDWTKYFHSCFCDDVFDGPPPPAAASLPTVVTTCVDDSSQTANRQTELDQILDEIVRDIDLLDQTLADSSGQ